MVGRRVLRMVGGASLTHPTRVAALVLMHTGTNPAAREDAIGRVLAFLDR